ncbi:FERM, ARHGEF and pleckstrin domain-containing protein 1 [Trichonephila clavipes]|nr:FERM, ARHGEF and pleckstrin domain-containing protein 1 [Trichonephila clavipes]
MCETLVTWYTSNALDQFLPYSTQQAFESPPPYQSSAKDLSSPVSQPRSSSNVHSETTSISTRCISSDEEMSRSPTSPLRSLREQCSTAHSPRSETDTEIRRKWFRDEVSKEENMPTHALTVLFGVVDPLYEFHCSFLRELEHRLATWEGRTGMPLQTHVQGVGDILLKKVQMTEVIFHAIFPSFDFIPV